MSQRWSAILTCWAEDERLEAIHWRALITLAGSVPAGSDIASVGERYIAKFLKLSQPTVHRRLKELEAWAYIEQMPRVNGARLQYRILNYPKFKGRGKERPEKKIVTAMTATVRQSAAAARITKDEVARILA